LTIDLKDEEAQVLKKKMHGMIIGLNLPSPALDWPAEVLGSFEILTGKTNGNNNLLEEIQIPNILTGFTKKELVMIVVTFEEITVQVEVPKVLSSAIENTETHFKEDLKIETFEIDLRMEDIWMIIGPGIMNMDQPKNQAEILADTSQADFPLKTLEGETLPKIIGAKIIILMKGGPRKSSAKVQARKVVLLTTDRVASQAESQLTGQGQKDPSSGG